MRTDFPNRYPSLFNSRNKWYSKSSTVVIFKPPSAFSTSALSGPSHLCYAYDNKSLSQLKASTFCKSNFTLIKNKLKHKVISQDRYDQFHYNALRTNFQQNSVFITKANEDILQLNPNQHHPRSLYQLTLRTNSPHLRMSNDPIHPYETLRALTQRCNQLSRLSYLTKAQRKTLGNLEDKEKQKGEGIEFEKRRIMTQCGRLQTDILKPLDQYINFLYKITDKEAKELKHLREKRYLLQAEVKRLSNTIFNKEGYSNRLASMRLFLICAKEAINTDKASDENWRKLFKGGFLVLKQKRRASTKLNSPKKKSNAVLCYFHYAFDVLSKDKELKRYYCNKYKEKVLVFDSVEDFFEKMQFYENKIIEHLREYEKRRDNNLELEKVLGNINREYSSLKEMNKQRYDEKELELELVKALNDKLLRTEEQLDKRKGSRLSLQLVKIPRNIPCMNSSQSEKVLSTYKYESKALKYPIPYTCILSRLCSIAKNILKSNAKFLIFDETTSFCSFGMKELNKIMKKRITFANEHELCGDIIKMLRVIDRSFKHLHLPFKKLNENTVANNAISKITSNLEKQRKINSIKQQRKNIETIHSLILRGIEEKTYKPNYHLKKRHEDYYYKTQSQRLGRRNSYQMLLNSERSKELHLQDILFY